jgi:hypothetical protein
MHVIIMDLFKLQLLIIDFFGILKFCYINYL